MCVCVSVCVYIYIYIYASVFLLRVFKNRRRGFFLNIFIDFFTNILSIC